MVSVAFQIMGMALSVVGWIGTIITCALPMWKVTAFIGTNIVTAQITWEGLWMSCVVQSTGQMQCKVYDSMLALPQDIQTARALMVISVLLALLGLMVGVVGAKCTNCVEEEDVKARIVIVAGAIFVVSGILCLIPVCWSANSIIREFYSPLIVEAQKKELGSSLYLGWAAAALMILGGGLLCCSCPKKESNNYNARYTAAVSQPRSDYPSKNYV